MKKFAAASTVAVLVAAAVSAAPAAGHYANPGGVDCGAVTFKKNTDWQTTVTARGVSCKEGRRLAWDLKDRRYGVYKRYRCVSRDRRDGDADNAMAHSEVRCVKKKRPSAVVTFVQY